MRCCCAWQGWAHIRAEHEVTHAVQEADATATANGNEERVRLHDKPPLLGLAPASVVRSVAGGFKPRSAEARVQLLQLQLLL